MLWRALFFVATAAAAAAAGGGGADAGAQGVGHAVGVDHPVDRAVAAVPPQTHMNTTQIIRSYGYPVEEHRIVTLDGFILQAERVPHGRNATTGGGPPVFIQPGLTCSTSVFVAQPAPRGLPFALADAGYDVWLINQRCRPQPLHVEYKPTDFKMWDWSYDEIAGQDVRAGLEYIHNVTGVAQTAAFIGHSQGGSVGFVAFSYYPELAARIKLFVSLAGPFLPPKAPTAMAQRRSRRSFACPARSDWPGCCDGIFGVYNGMNITWELCNTLPGVCEDAVCFITGCESKTSVRPDLLTVFLGNYPSLTSLKNNDHWDQSTAVVGGWRMFDYGTIGNYEHYNQPFPPIYNVTQLAARTALFYGTNDRFCPVELYDKYLSLMPADQLALVRRLDYGHLDFLAASSSYDLVYRPIIELLNNQTTTKDITTREPAEVEHIF